VTEIICGVDVSSSALDARIGQDGAETRMATTPGGVAALAAFCCEHRVTLVVMEATGGYEKLVHALLWSHGIPAAIVNPRSVRQFAQSMGFLEKTDRIDAGVIAWYAHTKHIVAQEPASDAQQHLKALVTRLRQLTELRTMQSNQRRLVGDPDVNGMFSDMLALIARQTRALEAKIIALIDSDPVWQKLDECFRSIKGVSDRTVARVMAEMPEIGTVSNKAVSKLAGLAPLANDSGKSQGKRSIHGGRQCAQHPVRDRRERPEIRSGLRRLPQTVDGRGQAQEGHPRRFGPQAPGPAQRQSTRRTEGTRHGSLTRPTVAHPATTRLAALAKSPHPSPTRGEGAQPSTAP
jgi:transposase